MVQYERDRDAGLWRQLKENEKFRSLFITQQTYACPECGTAFENDEPEKRYLCNECGRKELQKLFDEREQELRDMERESTRRRQSAIESKCRILASKGCYIDHKDPDKWLEFWDMCAANGKNLERMMTKS